MLLFTGASGAGKTYTSLLTATWYKKLNKKLLNKDSRVCVIDTENNASYHYYNKFNGDFDVIDIPADDFNPNKAIQTWYDATQAGYDIIVTDSLSATWIGANAPGANVEKISGARVDSNGRKTNGLSEWRKVKAQHHAMLLAAERMPADFIFTAKERSVLSVNRKSKENSVSINPDKIYLYDGADSSEMKGYMFDEVLDYRVQLLKTAFVTMNPAHPATLIKNQNQMDEYAEIWGLKNILIRDGRLKQLDLAYCFNKARNHLLYQHFNSHFSKLTVAIMWCQNNQYRVSEELLELFKTNPHATASDIKNHINLAQINLSDEDKNLLSALFKE